MYHLNYTNPARRNNFRRQNSTFVLSNCEISSGLSLCTVSSYNDDLRTRSSRALPRYPLYPKSRSLSSSRSLWRVDIAGRSIHCSSRQYSRVPAITNVRECVCVYMCASSMQPCMQVYVFRVHTCFISRCLRSNVFSTRHKLITHWGTVSVMLQRL